MYAAERRQGTKKKLEPVPVLERKETIVTCRVLKEEIRSLIVVFDVKRIRDHDTRDI